MKKNLVLAVSLLLTLLGCTTTEKIKPEDMIILPTVVKTEKIVVDEETNISYIGEININPEVLNIETNNIDYVDIVNKRYKQKVSYNGNSEIPFTGTFVLRVGTQKYYTEEHIDGKLNGEKIWYSEVGNVVMIERYKDGKKEGLQETFYDISGAKRTTMNYVNGRLEGDYIWLKEDGSVVYKETFEDGTGNWKTFWDNGKLREEGKLSKGRPTGTWTKYMEDGKKEKITRYGKKTTIDWLE